MFAEVFFFLLANFYQKSSKSSFSSSPPNNKSRSSSATDGCGCGCTCGGGGAWFAPPAVVLVAFLCKGTSDVASSSSKRMLSRSSGQSGDPCSPDDWFVSDQLDPLTDDGAAIEPRLGDFDDGALDEDDLGEDLLRRLAGAAKDANELLGITEDVARADTGGTRGVGAPTENIGVAIWDCCGALLVPWPKVGIKLWNWIPCSDS